MPNEFEKQVQQMMDELKLVPSEPVWQKVEMQIRKKKDRRRLIFWISFLILLLGGGLWIGVSQYSSQVSYNKGNNLTEKTNPKPIVQNPVTNDSKIIEKKSTANTKTTTTNVPQKEKAIPEHKTVNLSFSKKPVLPKDVYKKTNEPTEKTSEKQNGIQLNTEESEVSEKAKNEVVVNQASIKKILDEGVPNVAIQTRTDTANAALLNEKKIEPAISIIDSVKQDSASSKNKVQKQDTSAVKKTDVKKYIASKWKLNLVVASGLSGLSKLDFLNVFDGQKSMDALYQNSPGSVTNPGVTYYGPSPIKKGLSFSIGGATQKQLSKRLVFSAGLQYNYYSNSILVGNKVRRDTVFRSSYSVSQYFTNNAATYSLLLERYHNHYHFISIPLTIDWQMFKKFPLNFHAGFSVQQMIQTNALTFDYNAQAYYHNNKAFNKTLVFTEYGFNYSIPFANHYLALGPQLQYGLTALEKNNSTHHLFSYGLKAQLQFNKK